MMTTTLIETHKVFEGEQRKYRHFSETLDCDMVFSLFLPKQTDNKPTSLDLVAFGTDLHGRQLQPKRRIPKIRKPTPIGGCHAGYFTARN